MTDIKFDDKRLNKVYSNIAKLENDSAKIDTENERTQLQEYLSGNAQSISAHDRALLESGVFDFDNKDVKKAYKKIAKKNNNDKIDTKDEVNALKQYLKDNADNLSQNDKMLLTSMLNSAVVDNNIDISGDNNNVQINLGEQSEDGAPKIVTTPQAGADDPAPQAGAPKADEELPGAKRSLRLRKRDVQFDDKKVKRLFNSIAKLEGDSKKIDSALERSKVADLLEKYKDKISDHDKALLQSSSTDFDNKDVKKAYKKIAKQNKNDIIDTAEERAALQQYITDNADNLSENDRTLLTNLLNASTQETNINIKGDKNNVQITTPSDDDVTPSPVVGDDDAGTPNPVVGDDDAPTPIGGGNRKPPVGKDDDNTNPPSDDKDKDNAKDDIANPKPYKVNHGDNWYKVIKENYNVTSEKDVAKLIRKFKRDYFNANKTRLIRQGHTSDRSNFFYGVNDTMNLPQTIEIDGQTYTLK